VQVRVEGQATLSELAHFLYHFHRADLLQRISRLDVSSTTNEGDPVLKVSLSAEGLSLQNVPPRDRLFPEALLIEDADEDSDRLVVSAPAAFKAPASAPPFRVRIGEEYAQVTETDGNEWTVERGVDSTAPVFHAAGEVVELAPVKAELAKIGIDEYWDILLAGPFAKPPPIIDYEPRLDFADRAVVRGGPFEFVVNLSGYDAARGEVTYTFDSAPDGLEIVETNGASATVRWSPAEDQPFGEYEATLAVRQGGAEPLVTKTATHTLVEPNQPPSLAEIEDQSAYYGQPLSVKTIVDDPNGDALLFLIGDGAPAGVMVNESSGEFTWTPAPNVPPGDYEVTVIVTDAGTPPMSDTATFTVTVGHDTALFTYLVGVRGTRTATAADQPAPARREAWLYDRLHDEEYVVEEGQSLDVAGIKGIVRSIGRDFLLLERDRETYRLNLGENLRSLVRVEGGDRPAPAPATSPTATEPPPPQPPKDAADF
ncbi:MAG: Ig domain-containing protein, partial [Planctomycetaceae bacterium]